MCINDCCINCMCIHVITVTSHEPWTQHQAFEATYTIYTMHISRYNTEMWTDREKYRYTVKKVPLTKNRWRAPSSPSIRFNIFDAKILFCIAFINRQSSSLRSICSGFYWSTSKLDPAELYYWMLHWWQLQQPICHRSSPNNGVYDNSKSCFSYFWVTW